ncbi:MAG: alpha/beta hydrolase [Microbacterium sp.]
MRTRSLALVTRESDLGLRRQVVGTTAGRIAVRTGRRSTSTATILLHGAAGSWTTWTPLIVASDRTGRPLHDLVVPDLRGWGESGALKSSADVAGIAASVAELARSLGYARWNVVGHSLGGFVALELAASEPAATRSVVLVSSSGAGVMDAVRRPLRGGLRLPGFAGMLLAMRVLDAGGAGGRGLLRALRRIGLLRPAAAPLFAHSFAIDRSVVEALADEIRPASFLAAARAAAAYDETRWQGITAPVVSLRGRSDVFSGARDEDVFDALIPALTQRRIHDAGHFAHIERPDILLEAMRSAAGARLGGRRVARGAAA